MRLRWTVLGALLVHVESMLRRRGCNVPLLANLQVGQRVAGMRPKVAHGGPNMGVELNQ